MPWQQVGSAPTIAARKVTATPRASPGNRPIGGAGWLHSQWSLVWFSFLAPLRPRMA